MINITHYNLKGHNTFGIDATCKRFIEFNSVAELDEVLSQLTVADQPLLLLGGGSNLLLTQDFAGTVLHSNIKGHSVETQGDNILVKFGSGEIWDNVVDLCVKNGWYGLENLSYIPGEVGASAVQNIGAYGVEAKDFIYRVEAVEIATGKHVEFNNADCEYAYRQSRFKKEWKNKYVVTYVTYRLSKHFVPDLEYGNIRSQLAQRHIEQPTAQQLREVIIDIRKAKLPDPHVEGNAGSFFMNPVVSVETYKTLFALYADMPHYKVDDAHIKIPAGWMIDQCGWKGKSLGRAGVHRNQALVLVNKCGATGNDIVRLCDAIRKDVKDRFGIDIMPEVNIV